ncbi:MAG: MBL fold metallo-hydrolase [Candidatus Adiutrix sp.]|nr:MBL fold metallo-hydrolase [Candidatus Adiutrix sp.]
MKIKFWGVRGSIPAPFHAADITWKLEQILALALDVPLADPRRVADFIAGLPSHLLHPVGGSTPCVEVTLGADRVILDAGSGIRRLGLDMCPEQFFPENDLDLINFKENLINPCPPAERNITILLSHTHWDHIQGFPFFAPAYGVGNRISLYGHDGGQLAEAFGSQQKAPQMFPISLSDMGADLSFHSFPEAGLTVGGLTVAALPLPHPGGGLAFRVSGGGRSVVYATDYEFTDDNSRETARFVDFMAGADVVISDTQYTYLESVAREGWGHSTSFGALELAMRAEAGYFFLFHHDPEHSDAKLLDNLEKTRAYQVMSSGSLRVELASEGLSLEL